MHVTLSRIASVVSVMARRRPAGVCVAARFLLGQILAAGVTSIYSDPAGSEYVTPDVRERAGKLAEALAARSQAVAVAARSREAA